VYLLPDASESDLVIDTVKELLGNHGYLLKRENHQSVDIQSEWITILGYQLKLNRNDIELRIGEESWKQMQSSIEAAFMTNDPTSTIKSIVNNWIRSHGPALFWWKKRDTGRLKTILNQYQLSYLITDDWLKPILEKEKGRWRSSLQSWDLDRGTM
jgi:hypothetical protein